MKDKRKHHGAVGKLSSEVNPLPLPVLCEISRALLLVQPGLMADRQVAGRQRKHR